MCIKLEKLIKKATERKIESKSWRARQKAYIDNLFKKELKL